MSNTGHEAKAPMKRRRWGIKAEAAMGWKRHWGNREGSEGGSTMLARTFARPFPGGQGKLSVPLMWRFSLENGDVFETKPPHHHVIGLFFELHVSPDQVNGGRPRVQGHGRRRL
jgi:hypothetical protein